MGTTVSIAVPTRKPLAVVGAWHPPPLCPVGWAAWGKAQGPWTLKSDKVGQSVHCAWGRRGQAPIAAGGAVAVEGVGGGCVCSFFV